MSPLSLSVILPFSLSVSRILHYADGRKCSQWSEKCITEKVVSQKDDPILASFHEGGFSFRVCGVIAGDARKRRKEMAREEEGRGKFVDFIMHTGKRGRREVEGEKERERVEGVKERRERGKYHFPHDG